MMHIFQKISSHWNTKQILEKIFWFVFTLFTICLCFYCFYFQDLIVTYRDFEQKIIEKSSITQPKTTNEILENLISNGKNLALTYSKEQHNTFYLQGNGEIKALMEWIYLIENNIQVFIKDIRITPRDSMLYFQILLEIQGI